jgi:putative cardiolipin synthase
MCRFKFAPLLVLFSAVALGACASLPHSFDVPKQRSVAFAHPEETQVGQHFADAAGDHPGNSAFRIISVGVDGFAARIQLIDAATQSLDLQYFIFRQDNTGQLLTDALLRAADRGVQVRLLVDDADRAKGDRRIALLTAHPRIEVRIFNPWVYRGDSSLLRSVEFIFSHRRLDFRMHNKLIIADNASALIGGRNIGDQYFQIDPRGQFADDDVFVAGPTVQRLSATFDDYWNSGPSIPVEALEGGRPAEPAFTEYRQHLQEQWQKAQSDGIGYMKQAEGGDPLSGILHGQLPLVWSSALVVCDSPEKRLIKAGSMVGRLMYQPFAQTAAAAQSELLMITPYFVPTRDERQLLLGLRQRNVRVRILTNSLDSTSSLLAHAGYVRSRKALLQSGVEFYEIRALIGNTRGSGQTAAISRHGNYGLHAKFFVIDRQKLYIGSMNFDQRSVQLNTEVGLIIGSAELAQQTVTRFEAMSQPANAYQVVLQPSGTGGSQMIWRTEETGRSVDYTREPARHEWRRYAAHLLSHLPLGREL